MSDCVCVFVDLLYTACRYDRLEIDKSLCDNLRHKTLVEFPSLHVVLREESNLRATSEWVVNLFVHSLYHWVRATHLSCTTTSSTGSR